MQTNRNIAGGTGGTVLFVQPEHVRAEVKRQLLLLDDWQLSALDKASGEAKVSAGAGGERENTETPLFNRVHVFRPCCVLEISVLKLQLTPFEQRSCINLKGGEIFRNGMALTQVQEKRFFFLFLFFDHNPFLFPGLTRLNMSSCFFYSLTLREKIDAKQ